MPKTERKKSICNETSGSLNSIVKKKYNLPKQLIENNLISVSKVNISYTAKLLEQIEWEVF